jgi:hypothetical protein
MTLICYSKVAGVTSGPTAQSRQNCLEFIKKVGLLPLDVSIPLRLIPEPENPHDPDAVRVELEYEPGKFFHLGYIPNSDTICRECDKMFERHPGGNSCPNCGRKGHLERFGTATRIKEHLPAPGNSVDLWAVVTEITGGKDGQSLGCNIGVHKCQQ